MRVAIRTDSSNQIGTGHVIRCLTLAAGLKVNGVDCVFVCKAHSGNLLELIRSRGFESRSLPVVSPDASRLPSRADLAHADWLGSDWETDAAETSAVLEGEPYDWLITDHYALDARWEFAMSPHYRRLMVIDDLADRKHECDLLLDQNLIAGLEWRYDELVSEASVKLLGPRFALLQPEYADLHERTSTREGRPARILVYFGGADPDNFTGRAIQAFLALDRLDLQLDVVINPHGEHADNVRLLAADSEQVTLYERMLTLAPLMAQADFALGGGGATSWERCCLGLPAAVITLAENQIPIASELHRKNLIVWLGHKDQVDDHGLRSALRRIVDEDCTSNQSSDCMEVVDGRGVERVLERLLS